MRSRKDLYDRRKHRRFKVPVDAFAIIKKPSFKLGQITDMSKGGISFYYIGEKEFANNGFSVDILLADNDFYIDNLPVNIVSNIIVPVWAPREKAIFKRCGFKFRDLNSSQKSKLSFFVPTQSGGFIKDQRVA